MSFFEQMIPHNLKTDGVHPYVTFGTNKTRPKPISPQDLCSPCNGERKKGRESSAIQIGFNAQQKPMEIQVFNGFVKHNNRSNVNTASYSTQLHSPHVLLPFENDSSTYEMLFENTNCCKESCFSLTTHWFGMTFDCWMISVDCLSGKTISWWTADQLDSR